MSEQLKPCPFCGGPAEAEVIEDFLGFSAEICGCEDCTVRCCNREQWNRRVPGPATKKMLEWVRLHKPQYAGTFYAIMDAFLAEWEPTTDKPGESA